jgi:hypothetical protein
MATKKKIRSAGPRGPRFTELIPSDNVRYGRPAPGKDPDYNMTEEITPKRVFLIAKIGYRNIRTLSNPIRDPYLSKRHIGFLQNDGRFGLTDPELYQYFSALEAKAIIRKFDTHSDPDVKFVPVPAAMGKHGNITRIDYATAHKLSGGFDNILMIRKRKRTKAKTKRCKCR